MKALPLSDPPGKEACLLFLFFFKEKNIISELILSRIGPKG